MLERGRCHVMCGPESLPWIIKSFPGPPRCSLSLCARPDASKDVAEALLCRHVPAAPGTGDLGREETRGPGQRKDWVLLHRKYYHILEI